MKNGPGSMNRVYRLIWNESVGAFVAVAEFARGRGKRSSKVMGAVLIGGVISTTAASAAGPPAANALPTGGTVAAGQASISQSGTAMNVLQSSDRAAINWQTFNIGSAATVNFAQPSASSFTLSRVQSADPSAIFGRLTSNGQVMLVNPNGIVFGLGSSVDVGGLVASTLNITDTDFMARRLSFARGDTNASVVNQGTLTSADGGYIALLAPEVRNQGVIKAQLGTVALVAGDAVALDISGNGLLNVRVDPATVDAMVENSNLVKADGGKVFLSAGAANRLIEQAIAGHSVIGSQLVAENGRMRLVAVGGTVSAAGGAVKIEGNTVDAYGKTDVGGSHAGHIDISADFVSQSGQLRADSSVGKGGSIAIDAASIVQTASTTISADGLAGGGSLSMTGATRGSAQADDHGVIYSSASLSAQGTSVGAMGGRISVTADSVQLRAATLDASGQGAGGSIKVGGGFRGVDSTIANAQEVGINGSTVLRADAGISGNGGQVVVWSDQTTTYGGQISARGGSQSGNGGEAEVSGKGSLAFAGSVDLSAAHGNSGNLALDPHNIIIDDVSAAIVSLNISDPNANANRANLFASSVSVLANGNVVVTAPGTTVGGLAKAGATYSFNSRNGSLLNQLYGTHANDQVGSGGVSVLSNDNYLVLSPYWNPNSTSTSFYYGAGTSFSKLAVTGATAGAITWQNGAPTGSTGTGSTGGATASTAVTASGSNLVTANNSLVGSNLSYDRVGQTNSSNIVATVSGSSYYLNTSTTITALNDGNVAVSVPMWNSGKGAVTWINASNGQLGDGSQGGAISSTNSLVGTRGVRDAALTETANTHSYYILGYNSSGPTNTWSFTNPTSPSSNGYTTQQTNPLTIGAGDMVGQTVTALANGKFAVTSPNWTNGSANYAGAVTWGGSGNLTGAVGASNSLVGNTSFDFVGSAGITLVGTPANSSALAPNYLVLSPYWGGNGSFFNTVGKGAVTWVNGGTGLINQASATGAVVSASNSLIGNAGDMFAAVSYQDSFSNYYYSTTRSSGQSASTSNNYDAAVKRRNANSSGATVLTNGNVVIRDNYWTTNKGSVTLIQGDTGKFGNGSTAAVGTVSASNSLVGGSAGDYVGSGSLLELSNHDFVLQSNSWGGAKGAVTLVSGNNGQILGESNGVYGAVVSSTNSLVGSTSNDNVGSGGIFGVGTKDATTNLWSDYLVLSPNWGATNGVNAMGAVTWGGGSTGVRGLVSNSNSLVGSATDYVGSVVSSETRTGTSINNGQLFDGRYTLGANWTINRSASVDILANGNYLVRSPNWSGGKGAVTWGNGTTGVSGAVGSSNSLVGTVADVVTTATVTNIHADGRSYDDTTYTMSTVGDHIGLTGKALSNSAYVVASPFWNAGRGALTWISPVGQFSSTVASNTAAAGQVSNINSLVGSNPDVYSSTPLTGAPGGAGGDMTLAAGTSSLLPIYSVTTGDHLGAVIEKTTYFKPVESKQQNSATVGTTLTLPLLPYLFANSSTVKQTTGTSPNYQQRLTGYGYSANAPSANIVEIGTTGAFLVGSGGWQNGSVVEAGAVTFGSAATGLPVGTLGTSNSLVGNNNYDRVGRNLYANYGGAGYSGVFALSNNNFVLTSAGWNNGSDATTYTPGNGIGAVTWGSTTAGFSNGTISSNNSLVGSTAADQIGSAGVSVLNDGNYVVSSTYWDNGAATNAGAVTWGNGAIGTSGVVSSTNSLVGTQTNDQVGSSGVTVLAGGAYVVNSAYSWANGSAARAGAVTYGASSTGVSGVVSASNSLVGTNANDYVGSGGVTALPGGAYVVSSSNWANGSATYAGAVTYGVVGSGISGVVSASNSVVGTTAYDQVGNYGVQLISDQNASYTNYLIKSGSWTDASISASSTGAVTWVNGSTGYVYGTASGNRGATISTSNSLVGNYSNDYFGNSVQATTVKVGGQTIKTGDAMVNASNTRVGDLTGVVTLIPGDTGLAGRVSSRNSILGFNDSTHLNVGNLQYAMLPYTTTSLELVKYRTLVWTNVQSSGYYSDNSKLMAISLVNEQAATPTGSLGHNAISTNVGDGLDWTTNGRLLNTVADLTDYGYTNGLLSFTAGGNGSDAVISPGAITALLNAGTNVTLQANNDITVLKSIISSASGQGGDLTLQAGRSIRLYASINTDNGNFTALANESQAHGVVSADSDSSSVTRAELIMAPGASVNSGTGRVQMELLAANDKSKTSQTFTRTNNDPTNYYTPTYTVNFSTTALNSNSSGDIVLGDLSGASIFVNNQGGSNVVANYGNVRNNAASSVVFNKTGSAGGSLSFSAWRDIVFGRTTASQTVSVDNANGASGAINLVLDSDNGGNHVGAISLANFSANSYGGNIALGGGALAQGLPSGAAYADVTGGSTYTQNYGVSITDTSSIHAGNGMVTVSGYSNAATGSGVYIAGSSAQAPVVLDGASVTLAGQRGSTGTTGAGITLGNVVIGDAMLTTDVSLRASGFVNTGGSVAINSGTTFVGKSGSVLTAAADQTGVAAQISGTSNSGSGFWVADGANGGNLAALMNNATGFEQLVLGRNDQSGATTLQSMNLSTLLTTPPGNFNLRVVGGQGGTVVAGTVTGQLASGKRLTMSAANGGTLALGNAAIGADLLELAATGTGSAITQGNSGVLTATGALISAPDASVNLAGSNMIGSVGGQVGSGAINNAQTLNIDTVMGANGLAATGEFKVTATGGTSDLVVNQAVSSQTGNLTLASGRYFKNTVALDQGVLAANGHYWVYSKQPTTLNDNITSARGMRNFSKKYGVSYTGTNPANSDTANWFFYSDVPQLTVAAGSSTITYGTASSASGLTYTGFIDGDTQTSAGLAGAPSGTFSSYAPSGANFRPVGTYAVTLTGTGTLANSLGYVVAVQNGTGTLTVVAKDVSMSGSRVYDGTVQVASTDLSQITGLLSGDQVAANTALQGTVVSGVVGTGKAVTLSGSPLLSGNDAANYNVTGATLAVAPRPINVSADAKSKVYGETNPALTYTAEAPTTGHGLVGGDSLTGVLATAATHSSNVGSYGVTQGTLVNDNNSNYTISFTEGALGVTARPINVSAEAKSRVYGEANPALTYTAETQTTGHGLVSGDSLTGALATTATHSSNVGSYGVTQGTLVNGNNSNYTISFTEGTLGVTARPINVSADAKSKVYGEANPTFTYTAEAPSTGHGLLSGDSLTGVLATTATHSSNVGSYGVTQGTLVNGNNSNYTISFTEGTLGVTARPINVSADAKSKVYGEANPTFTYTAEAPSTGHGLLSGDSLTGVLATTATNSSNVGSYGVTQGTLVNGNNSNYTISFTEGALGVTARPINVSADAKSKVYGETDPVLTYVAEVASVGHGLVAGDHLNGDLVRVAGETVAGGPYPIQQGTVTHSNYDITYTAANLTVDRAPLTVTADDKSKLYSDTDPTLSYTVDSTQLKHQDQSSVVSGITLRTQTGINLPVGTYPIVNTGGQAANYALTLVDGNLTVAPSSTLRSENLITTETTAPVATTALQPAPEPLQAPAEVPGIAPTEVNLQPGTVVTRDGGLLVSTAISTTSTEPSQPATPTAAPFSPTTAATNGSSTADSVPSAPAVASVVPDSSRLVAVRPDVQIQAAAGRPIVIPMNNVFQTNDPNVKLTFTVTQSNGQPLPSWVRFDPVTGTVSGTPPAGFSGNIKAVVVARDSNGQSASVAVDINVASPTGSGNANPR